MYIYLGNIGISHSTVSRIAKKSRLGYSLTSKARSGRPTLTSRRDESLMVKNVLENPSISSTELSKKLLEEIDLSISPSTLRKKLLNCGLKSYSSKKKPFLTKK